MMRSQLDFQREERKYQTLMEQYDTKMQKIEETDWIDADTKKRMKQQLLAERLGIDIPARVIYPEAYETDPLQALTRQQWKAQTKVPTAEELKADPTPENFLKGAELGYWEATETPEEQAGYKVSGIRLWYERRKQETYLNYYNDSMEIYNRTKDRYDLPLSYKEWQDAGAPRAGQNARTQAREFIWGTPEFKWQTP